MGIFADLRVLGIILCTVACVNSDLATGNFNVLDFGAVGDSHHDDSQAFLKAWNATCNENTGTPTMIIPEGMTFFLSPLKFNGPCKAANLQVKIDGNIVAPDTPAAWEGISAAEWISFFRVTDLNITGSGTVDGRGKGWWDQSCRYHPQLPGCTKLAPTAMKFLQCNNTHVSNIHILNSPQTHILIMDCYGFDIDNVNILSPETSPNTDGIHIHISENVTVQNSTISSGDDCISIGSQIKSIKIHTINCGPGHGISIGSLGYKGDEAKVEDIDVWNSTFYGTTNGIRIKTYQVGKGYARDFSFRQLNFNNVSNPIIIDQYYCEVAGACKSTTTGVKISNVTYEGFTGTSQTRFAVALNCSSVVPCTELTFKSIQLSSAIPGRDVSSCCINAHGQTTGVVHPSIPCLQ